GERDAHAGLVQSRGVLGIDLTEPLAFVARLLRQRLFRFVVRLAETDAQDDRDVFLFKPFGNFPRLPAAIEDRLELEFGREIERAVDLVARVRLEYDRLFPLQNR